MPRKPLPPMERFMKFVNISDTGCWSWIGAIDRGRCTFWLNPGNIKAQDFIYGSPPPSGYVFYQTCANPICVNPDHLVIRKAQKKILRKEDPLTLFMSHVKKLDNGCWEWTAAKSSGGYGIFRRNNENRPAHRWIYEYYNGAIPAGLECDHLCRNRACVNPDHIEPVTKLENVRRGESGKKQRDKTHCAKGHPYDAKNTVWYPHKHNGHIYLTRHCKQCIADRRSRPELREHHRRYVKEWYRKQKLSSQIPVVYSSATPV